jgi:biofilm PGA synthesis N-glycosyltransferase PgaC
MFIAAIVSFLDEEEHLPPMLASIEAQSRAPDRLLLVDDGSRDHSAAIAGEFAARHSYALLARRPVRPAERDRMVTAPELRAFEHGLAQVPEPWEVAAKLDADLVLTPDYFAEIERQFEADARLGMAGAYLSALDGGRLRRQRCADGHVEGENTFYRRACYEQIAPLPPMLGWDTIDELRARMHGWRTATFEIPSGDPLHMRRMGSHDGLLRGYRRAGWAAYAYGAHPAHVALGAAARAGEQPALLCGLNYFAGWLAAAARREQRAEPEVRRFARGENLVRIRRMIREAAT